MSLPEKVFRTNFHERVCPKCKENIKPITYGETNQMHGYKLACPECEAFIGWGGKIFKEHLITAGD